MDVFIIVLIIIAAVLLVLVVLAQNPKGGGASNFGGSGSSQLIGVKKTGDLLEKLTWGFAIAIIVLCLAVNLVMKPNELENEEAAPAATEEQAAPAQQQQTAPAQKAPASSPAPTDLTK